ncbi:CheR family methyltransferase [Flavobacterium sp. ST-87]|uniref:protein-glutamate O-methyltransferase n=1 Tax=Flavobacterium plantiphilum TaxID=3163297 RepID=A0ABW8XWY2_9FLAO
MEILIKKKLQADMSNLLVVGIGISIGSLETLKKILLAIPQDSGIAFIIIRHTEDLPANLAEILSSNIQIPVNEIINDIHLEPNHIYIMPEKNFLTTSSGILKLKQITRNERQGSGTDIFFESLAEVYKSAVVGLMLGSDSNFESIRGFKKIKEEGGITIIQKPDKTAFRGITQHLRDNYVADYVMTTEHFPFEMLQIQKKYPAYINANNQENIPQDKKELFRRIIELTAEKHQHDFSNYKQAYLRRRIVIRMTVLQKDSVEGYYNFLQNNKTEQDILFHDFLFSVSYFFKDSDYFENLNEIIFPSLISNINDNTLRIWIAGCATGEETYSLAISLHEYLLKNKLSGMKVQIFATDLSERAIIKARSGIYSNFDVQQINKERLQKYFIKSNREYQVCKVIRDMCVFAVHNFVKDPPFAKIDFVNCRNVLKYFNPFLQNKALLSFYYSLNDKGILFIGKSETINSVEGLFEATGKTQEIYIRKAAPEQDSVQVFTAVENNFQEKVSVSEFKTQTETDFQKIVSDILFSKYTPACVVINENMEIVYFHGDTSSFLSPSQGKPSFNILKMTDEEVRIKLQIAILKVKTEKRNIREDRIEVKKKSCFISFEIVVPQNNDSHLIIIFYNEAIKSKKRNENLFIGGKQKNTTEVTDENHLVNEVLRAQSQELASAKEELSCINAELRENQKELVKALDYGEAIINTIHEPLLIIDDYFFIKKANQAFYQCFKTTEAEIENQSLFEIGNCQWNIPGFKEQISKILNEQLVIEKSKVEIVCDGIGKKIMLINAGPIQVLNEDHILLTFNDITELVNANELLVAKKLEIQKYHHQLEAFTTAASDVLHEPLRKIHMFSKRTFDNESNISELGKHYLERIQYLVTNMSQLIDDVINYSRVNFLEREYKKTDLNKLFKKIIRDLKEIISQKNAEILVDNLPELNIIPQQIQQLFTQLIINSLIFTKEGVIPQIKIEAHTPSHKEIMDWNGEPEINYVKICIIDNGIGFEKEYETTVFNPFYRLHQNTFKGSGLGLTLVKKIVANHQGFIKAVSKKNRGTTMIIYIPMTLS